MNKLIRRVPLSIPTLALVLGCSSSHDAGPAEDPIQVVQFLKSFNGAKKNVKRASEWFAQGALPPEAELRKLAQYNCKIAERPSVKGDTATAKMKVLDARDQEVGVVEWTLVREGGNWKVKTAPVP